MSRDSRPDEAPLRVLQVVHRFFPELGGTETHVAEVTRRLAAAGGMEVTVLTTDRTGSLPSEEVVDGVRVIRTRSWPRNADFYLSPGLWRRIVGGPWDLVHFQGVHTCVPVVGMLAARSARLPYVLSFHSGGHSSAARSAVRGLQWRVLTPLLSGARRLIAVSRFERRRFADATRIGAERFVVIPNGGALPPVAAGVVPIPGRIISSGRLERYKGHHRVIEALPHVKQLLPEAHLVILGGGPYEAELRSTAERLGVQDSVAFRQLPPADRAAMSEELASASVMAAMSSYEAHPVAVMEAAALGLPIIGCDVAGIGDLVEDGLVHGVAPEADAQEVARALLDVLWDRGGGHGSAAPTAFRVRPGMRQDLPTWETCATAVAAVYREAVTAAGRPA